MPITPLPGKNVLENPSMLSTASWGDQLFATADGTDVNADIFSNWHDVYATFSHVVDGSRNALLIEEHTNYGVAFAGGAPQFSNDADFLTKAGQEWRVKFAWKRQSAENNRKRLRVSIKAGLIDGTILQIHGPWSTIDAQFGTAGYDWRFVFPKWWYDQPKWGSTAIGWTHSLESMFTLELGIWSGGPTYPNFNITDPHTDPNFSSFDFRLHLFAADVHWTGGYTNPADATPTPDPGDPIVPPEDPEEPTPLPAPGSYLDNLCGIFPGEALADTDGNYIGNAGLGDGPGGPYGWVNCTSTCENPSGLLRSYEIVPCACDFGGGFGQVRTTVPFEQPSQYLTGVVDTSGPPGLEAMVAMQVDLAGTHSGDATFVGSQAYDDALGEWVYDVIDGDTGWKPQSGELWVFQCWMKSVPDLNGVTVVADADLSFSGAMEGFAATSLTAHYPITADWTFVYEVFAWPGVDIGTPGHPGWVWPIIVFSGDGFEKEGTFIQSFGGHDFTLTGFQQLGRVLIKCPHLYPFVPPAAPAVWATDYAGRES